MSLLIYFTIALILSFLGSLPIGLITLTISQKTIEKGRKSGLLIASGALIMEFVYTYIALISLDIFTENTAIGNYIKTFATIVFFALGFYYLFKKSRTQNISAKDYDYFDFLRGIIVGMMNMLIIPYWIFFGLWLEANHLQFDRQACIIIFSAGAAIGAFIAFWLYILLSEFIIKKTKIIHRYTNKAVGILMLGLGVTQLIRLL